MDSAAHLAGGWAHESYGQNGAKGHQGQIELAAKSLPMPDEVAWGQTEVLLKHDADGLLREVGQRIRMDPSLTHQTGFIQIVESSGRFASAAARRGLGEALQAALDRPGLTASRREQIRATADFLKRPLK